MMSLNSVHIQNKVNKSGFLILDQYHIDFGGSTKNTSCTRQYYGMEGHLKPWEVPNVFFFFGETKSRLLVVTNSSK